MSGFSVTPIPGLPMVTGDDDLAVLIATALTDHMGRLADGDIVCVAQKVVSKAEGQLIPLSQVTPSPEAQSLAAETDKDPRLVELILRESTDVLRKKPGVLIVRHRLGIVGANAGIDQSNIDHGDEEQALLLPKDPDVSAAQIRNALQTHFGVSVGVIITDSHNRPWRLGTVGSAIGCAGVVVLDDHRGGADIYGRELKVTLINQADALAAAATLVMGETTEKIPLALIRGVAFKDAAQTAQDIHRPLAEDLFQ